MNSRSDVSDSDVVSTTTFPGLDAVRNLVLMQKSHAFNEL